MQIKKKTIQQKPIHVKQFILQLKKQTKRKLRNRKKKDQPKSLANAGCACGII